MTSERRSDVQAFWDQKYADGEFSRTVNRAVVDRAIIHFGNLTDKRVLDIGCGPGASSFYLACHSGAESVVGLDLSQKAIDDLNATCREHGITNVRGVHGDAFAIAQLGQFDAIYGSMILHHIEPFSKFAETLRRCLKPDGRAFFYENNATSRLLVWFRDHVVGRLYVPKHGDSEEFPLTPQEVDILRKHFTVAQEFPEMLFFRLAAHYLLRDHFMAAFSAMDRYCYRYKLLNRYSYHQYILLS